MGVGNRGRLSFAEDSLRRLTVRMKESMESEVLRVRDLEMRSFFCSISRGAWRERKWSSSVASEESESSAEKQEVKEAGERGWEEGEDGGEGEGGEEGGKWGSQAGREGS